MLVGTLAHHLLGGNLNLCLLQAPLRLIDTATVLPDPGLQVAQIAVAVPGVLSEEDIHEEVPLGEEASGQSLQAVA